MPVMCLYFASFGGQTPSAPGASRSGSDCIAIRTMDDKNAQCAASTRLFFDDVNGKQESGRAKAGRTRQIQRNEWLVRIQDELGEIRAR